MRYGVVLAVGLCWSACALGENWPQFRGPGGQAVSAAQRLPEVWNDAKNVAWKADIPGSGWSSPIVWGERVFLATAILENEAEELYRWEVLCFDALTGKLRWQKTAARGKPAAAIHPNNSYATETPATDGRALFAYFGMKGLFCFDMDGKLLWSKDVGVFPTVDDMGSGSSPVLADGRLFILCENLKSPFLAAFSSDTGAEIWRAKRPSKTSWSSPYVWRNRRRTEVVACGSGVVQAFDPATGKLLWEIRVDGRFTATPTGNDDLLFVGTASAFDEGPLFAVRAGAEGVLKLPAANGSNAWIAWSRTRSGPGMSSPVLAGDRLYLFHRGAAMCYEAATGKRIFRERLPEAGNFLASPFAANGKIYALDEDGQTFVMPGAAPFEVLASNWLKEKFWASPAVSSNSIFLRGESRLYCIRAQSE